MANNFSRAVKNTTDAGWKPHVIIADYQLAGSLDGLETVIKLKNYFKAEIPAIIVTGSANNSIIEKAQENKLPLLYKPIHANSLKSSLIKLIESETPKKRSEEVTETTSASTTTTTTTAKSSIKEPDFY